MTLIGIKKSKENIEVNVFHKKGTKSLYNNLINKDPNIIANVLMDLQVLGFPIIKAIKIFNKRVSEKDWFGI